MMSISGDSEPALRIPLLSHLFGCATESLHSIKQAADLVGRNSEALSKIPEMLKGGRLGALTKHMEGSSQLMV